jgi:hypothetical protein
MRCHAELEQPGSKFFFAFLGPVIGMKTDHIQAVGSVRKSNVPVNSKRWMVGTLRNRTAFSDASSGSEAYRHVGLPHAGVRAEGAERTQVRFHTVGATGEAGS